MAEEKLVSSVELARALGLHHRTVQRYIAEGKITPKYRTPGGHTRWSVNDVLEELRKQRESDED